MSFSTEIKEELCTLKPAGNSRAELYGCLYAAGHLSTAQPQFFTDHENLAMRMRRLCRSGWKQEALLDEEERGYLLTFPQQCLEDLAPDEAQIRMDLLRSPEELAAFVRGAFLVCGSITDPMKGYHLEFNPPDAHRTVELQTLLSSL